MTRLKETPQAAERSFGKHWCSEQVLSETRGLLIIHSWSTDGSEVNRLFSKEAGILGVQQSLAHSRLHPAVDHVSLKKKKTAKQGFLLGLHKSLCPCSLGKNYGWKIEIAGHLAKRKVNIWQEVYSCQEPFLFTSASDIYGFCAWSPCRWIIAESMTFIVPKFTGKLYSATPRLIYN